MFNRLLFFLIVLLAATLHLQAADQRVTLTLTITNLPVTSNTLAFTAPASKTITWTNVSGSANVITGATVAASTTNLFLNLAAYAIGTPRLTLVASSLTTNSFQMEGAVNQNIAVTSTGTGAGNWCTLTLSTSTVTRLTTVRVPIASEVGDTNRTNVGSLLVLGISDFSTNSFKSNSVALTHVLQLNTNVQQVLGEKKFDKLGNSTNIGIIYHGRYDSQTNVNPTFTNAINYGNAFRSVGTGGNSTQIGSNALANGLRNIAIGNDAFATNNEAIAIGNTATATNSDAIAIGRNTVVSKGSGIAIGLSADATGDAGVALGGSAQASSYTSVSIGGESSSSGGYSVSVGAAAGSSGTNSVAIGVSSSASAPDSTALGNGATVAATHTNSVAIGKGSATTTNHQIMLGSADSFLVETYARLQANSITNIVATGTNRIDGDWSWTPVAVTSLANGNNIAVPGTNVLIEVSGPTAAFTINGVTGGRSGRELIILNRAQQTMTVANESGVDPTAANRIWTPGYVDVTVQSNGWVRLKYNGTDSRWRLETAYPPVAVSTNTIGIGSDTQVTYNNAGVSDGASGVKVLNETNLTVTGAATNGSLTVSRSITHSAATASRVAIYNANKELTNSSTVSDTELGYLDGVTSAIQAQLDGKSDWLTFSNTATILMATNGGGDIYGTASNLISSSALRVWRSALPIGAFMNQMGLNTYNSGTYGGTEPTDAEGAAGKFTSSASTGADAGFYSDICVRLGTAAERNLVWRTSTKTTVTNAVRCWWGVTDQTISTMVASDNPAGNYAAFRYSTDGGDTTWQCITKDNSTQEITDSGITVTTNAVKFEIEFVDGEPAAYFRIDGVNVATNTANLPGAAGGRVAIGLETRENVAKIVQFQWFEIYSDE